MLPLQIQAMLCFMQSKVCLGCFVEHLQTCPSYYKVREYNNAESRDLWEYELNVDQETVDMLIAHYGRLVLLIDYWYLTENCSYHMFTLLEAANPKCFSDRKI